MLISRHQLNHHGQTDRFGIDDQHDADCPRGSVEATCKPG
jgi:hypothetical protein